MKEVIEIIKTENIKEINKLSKHTVFRVVRSGRIPNGPKQDTVSWIMDIYYEALSCYE